MEQNKGTAQATQGAEGQNGHSIPQSNVLLLHIQRADGSYQVTYEGQQRDFASPWKKEDLLSQLYRARVLTRQEAESRGVDLYNFPQFYYRKARVTLKEMGDQLYEAFFPPNSPIRQTLETHLQQALQQGRILSLRLQLDPDDAELWTFPWELLYAHWIEASGEIKATFTQTLNALAIIRYLPRKEAKPIFTRLQRIAFFAASPRGGAIPTHQTLEAIRSAWGVDRVLDAPNGGQSWEDWRALMAQSPDAVHFLGHGNENDQLAFVGEGNSPDLKGADKITNSLPASLKLLTLQACSSGHLAARLIQKHPHLPLAVGMHYEIGIEVADAFALGFYRTLLTSGRVEAAIAQARQRMLDRNKDNQWLLPIQTMGVPEAYFSSKVFPKVDRRLPKLTHVVEREQRPALQEKLFQHPFLALAGKPGSGRTWLALQALEKAGVPREQTRLFDLSQGGDIYALWHALLNAFELPGVQHLYDARELSEDRWKGMKKSLSQALWQKPHALLIKLPTQPPQDVQKEGWQHLFEALATKPPQAGQAPSPHPPQTIFILDQEGKSAWLDLIGKDVPSLTLKLSEKEIVKLLQAYGFPIHEEENYEEIETMRRRLSDETLWQLRQWLENYQGPRDLDKILEVWEREGFSLKDRWEKFSPLEQEVLKWAAIADAPLTPTDLLTLLNHTDLSLDKVEESLDALTQAEWLRPEESGYRLVPAARPFVLEQMEPSEQRRRQERWHHYQARVQQVAQVDEALDKGKLMETADLLLSEAWHPWAISPSYRYKLLEFIDELWKKKDALPADRPFKLAMRAALAARALGDYQTAADWYKRADRVAPTPEEHLQALIERAWMRHRVGSPDWEEIAEDVEDLLKEVQDPQLHAQWRFTQGAIHAEQLRYDKAVGSVEEGLQHLGLDDLNLSPEEAATTFSPIRRTLKRWVRHGGDPLLAAQAMRAYGLAMLYRDNLDVAVRAFRLSLRFYEETEDRYWIAIAHNNLAAALNRAGQTKDAEEYFQEAKPILAQLGDPTFAEMLQHFNGALSREYQLASYPKEIVPGIAKALTLARDYRYLQAIVPVHLEYGKALAMAGRWNEAASAMEEAQRWATTELRNPLMAHWADFYRAEINLYRWQAGEAELSLAPLSQWPEEPPASWKQDPRLEVASRIHLAQAYVLQGDIEKAQEVIAPVKPDAIHDPATLTKWYQLQGTLLAAKGEYEKAEAAFKEGLGQQGLGVYRTQLRYHYAQALLQAKKTKLAGAQLEQALEEAEQMEIPWLQAMIQALQAQIEP